MNNLRLAYVRCIRRGSQLGVVAVFIALMQCAQLLSAGLIPAMQSQLLSTSLEQLGTQDRWVSVTLGDATQLGRADKSQVATDALHELIKSDAVHFLAYRPVSDKANGRYQLAATSNLADQVVLKTGRLPAACTTNRCEVLATASNELGALPPYLVVTGTAALRTTAPIRAALDETAPTLIATDVAAIAGLEDFRGFPAAESWSAKLTSSAINSVGLDAYLDGINRVSNQLAITSGRFLLTAPLTQLTAIQNQGVVLEKRLQSLGLCVSIVGTFAVFLISRAARRRHAAFVTSAQRLQSDAFSPTLTTLFVAVFMSIAGTVAGLVAGAGTLLALGGSAGTGLPSEHGATIFAAATLLIFAGLSAGWLRSVAPVIAVMALWVWHAVSIQLDPLLAIYALVAAAVAGLLATLLRRIYRDLFVRSIQHSSRSWLNAIAISTAFITSSLLSGSVLLTTLEAGAADNATFTSPTATRLKMGGEATVMELNSLSDYQQLNGGSDVFQVRKVAAAMTDGEIKAAPLQLVSVDPRVWQAVPDISHQTGFDLRTLSALPNNDERNIGFKVQPNSLLETKVSGLNQNTYLGAWILTDRSESVLVTLSQAGATFTSRLPTGARSLIGFEITEYPHYKDRREHAVGEGINGLKVPTGDISISSVSVNGQPLSASIATTPYSLINGPVLLSLVAMPAELDAVVDSATVATADSNQLWIKLGADTAVKLNITGNSRSLPTVPMRFALVDGAQLTEVLAASHPELIRVAEVWATGNFPNDAETRSRLAGLSVINQSRVLSHKLEPVTVLWTHRGFGLLALAVIAMFMLLMWVALNAVHGDSEISAWAASGVQTLQLRRKIRQQVFSELVLGLATAAAVSYLLLPIYIGLQQFDFAGSLAYPELVTRWSSSHVAVFVVMILAVPAAITATAKRRQEVLSR